MGDNPLHLMYVVCYRLPNCNVAVGMGYNTMHLMEVVAMGYHLLYIAGIGYCK